MSRLGNTLQTYAADVRRRVDGSTSTETSYYPAIKALFDGILAERRLPFDVVTGTSERRAEGKGRDMPDLAFYEDDEPVVLVEVKLPSVEVAALAMSTENKDQIGRYLDAKGAVLVTTVRSFALVTTAAWQQLR